MSDERALLAAIRDNPDEDTPRLAYADWLDEHATTDAERARAEFIRLNCELIRLGGEFLAPLYTEDWWRIAARQYELVEQYHRQWLLGFPFPEELRPNHFNRGFADNLNLAGDGCLALPRPPWAREPALSIRLSGTTAQVCRVIRSEWLAGIDALQLPEDRGTDGDEIARALAEAPCATDLRWLYVMNQSLTVAGLRVLGRSTRFRRLRSLRLGGDFDADGWAAIANGAIADQLRVLSLTLAAWGMDRRPWAEAAAVLAASPGLAGLEELMITRTRLGPAGVGAFVSSPHLRNLKRLTFAQERFDEATAEVLGAFDAPALEQLVLHDCGLTDAALRPLAARAALARLTHLDLNRNPLTAVGMGTLAGAGPFLRLRSLCLDEVPLGNDGVITLARAAQFPALENLELVRCGIGPKGAAALAVAPWANGLVKLTLDGNSIRKGGVAALTAPGRLTGLHQLYLQKSVRGTSLKEMLTTRFGDGLNL